MQNLEVLRSAHDDFRMHPDDPAFEAKLLEAFLLTMRLAEVIDDLSRMSAGGGGQEAMTEYLCRQDLLADVNRVLAEGPSEADQILFANIEAMIGRSLFQEGAYRPIVTDDIRDALQGGGALAGGDDDAPVAV